MIMQHTIYVFDIDGHTVVIEEEKSINENTKMIIKSALNGETD